MLLSPDLAIVQELMPLLEARDQVAQQMAAGQRWNGASRAKTAGGGIAAEKLRSTVPTTVAWKLTPSSRTRNPTHDPRGDKIKGKSEKSGE
jgi:hypothetical protein